MRWVKGPSRYPEPSYKRMPTNEIRATQVGVLRGRLASSKAGRFPGAGSGSLIVIFENSNFPWRITV